MDKWQRNQEKNELCQCENESNKGIPTTTNPLIESYSTEDIAAIKQKIKEVMIGKKNSKQQISSHSDMVQMAESTWNRFLQPARDPAPQIKVTWIENNVQCRNGEKLLKIKFKLLTQILESSDKQPAYPKKIL